VKKQERHSRKIVSNPLTRPL